jgi:hypothetical protein
MEQINLGVTCHRVTPLLSQIINQLQNKNMNQTQQIPQTPPSKPAANANAFGGFMTQITGYPHIEMKQP